MPFSAVVNIRGAAAVCRPPSRASQALAGIATGIAVGALAGELRAVVLRLGPVLGPVLLGAAAMTVTDASLTRLGLTDPREWDATAWLSDAGPHLAFGVVSYAALRAMSRR